MKEILKQYLKTRPEKMRFGMSIPNWCLKRFTGVKLESTIFQATEVHQDSSHPENWNGVGSNSACSYKWHQHKFETLYCLRVASAIIQQKRSPKNTCSQQACSIAQLVPGTYAAILIAQHKKSIGRNFNN